MTTQPATAKQHQSKPSLNMTAYATNFSSYSKANLGMAATSRNTMGGFGVAKESKAVGANLTHKKRMLPSAATFKLPSRRSLVPLFKREIVKDMNGRSRGPTAG